VVPRVLTMKKEKIHTHLWTLYANMSFLYVKATLQKYKSPCYRSPEHHSCQRMLWWICAFYVAKQSTLLTKHYFGDQIKKNKMGWACSTYGGEERHIQGFGGETWGNKPLERPRHRWEGNIKMDLQEVEWGAWTGWIWLRIGTD